MAAVSKASKSFQGEKYPRSTLPGWITRSRKIVSHVVRCGFQPERPPFVSLSRKEAAKIVTLAARIGQLSQPEVQATLVTRKWDSVILSTIRVNG